MTWQIDYNGFGTNGSTDPLKWTSLHIDSYETMPIFEADGVSIRTHEHKLNGTALIHRGTAADLKTSWLSADATLSKQRATLLIVNDTGNEIVNLAAGGDEGVGTPRCDFRITEIAGAITLIVSFTITWHKRNVLASEGVVTDYNVMGHWWKQSFDIREDGLQVRTVDGRLSVRNDATAYAGGGDPASTTGLLGPNPDLYRTLIVPDLPLGFIRESMKWATDAEGQTLEYRIVDRQTARPVPGPAKKGTGRLRVVQSYDLKIRKFFRATLEGDKLASPGDLLTVLVRMAQNVIRFTGEGSDQILSVESAIEDIFNRNVVSLSVMSIGFPANTAQSLGVSGGASIFDKIVDNVELYPYEEPTEYGQSLIRSVRRLFYDPTTAYATDADFPKAKVEDVDTTPSESSYGVELLNEGGGSSVPQGTERAVKPHQKNPYLDIIVNEKITHSPNVVALKARRSASKTKVFQVEKPSVFLETEYVVTRQRTAPKRVYLKRVLGTLLKNETFAVSVGTVDASQNRTFTARYTRVLELLDHGQNGMWIDEQGTIPDLGEFRIRRWIPPLGLIGFPHDPRTEPEENTIVRSILDQPTDPDFLFAIDVDHVMGEYTSPLPP